MVIAIMSVLISLLGPSLKRTVYISEKFSCKNNIKQLVQGVIMYADDNNDYYPMTSSPRDGYIYHGLCRLDLPNGSPESQAELLRPYWGGNERVKARYFNNNGSQKGMMVFDVTDIERCPLRYSTQEGKNYWEYTGSYAYFFGLNGYQGSGIKVMERVGDVYHPGSTGTGALSQIEGTTALISDVFIDYSGWRYANHHEMESFVSPWIGFRLDGTWEMGVRSGYRPKMTANFAGDDGSVEEYAIPEAFDTWPDYSPEFIKIKGVQTPERFIVK